MLRMRIGNMIIDADNSDEILDIIDYYEGLQDEQVDMDDGIMQPYMSVGDFYCVHCGGSRYERTRKELTVACGECGATYEITTAYIRSSFIHDEGEDEDE